MRARVDFSFEYEVPDDELDKFYGTIDPEECIAYDKAGMESEDFGGLIDYLILTAENNTLRIDPRLEISLV